MMQALPSGVAQRRDDFLSPEFRWLVATLRQTARPLDRRNLAVLVDSFNRMAETAIDVEQVIADAESSGFSYLATWLEAARAQDLQPSEAALLDFLSSPIGEKSAVQANVEAILEHYTKRLDNPAADSDLAEDMTAWRDLKPGHRPAHREERSARTVPSGTSIALERTSPKAERSHADDDPWRQGPGIRLRVCHRHGRGRDAVFPEPAERRPQSGNGGGTAQLFRRDHTNEGMPCPQPREELSRLGEGTFTFSRRNGAR